jgi:hypothetical protein
VEKLILTSEDLFIHYRDKRQLKEIFNVASNLLETFLGTFTAHKKLQFRKTMNQFMHTQNLSGQVTAKNQKEIWAL